RPAAGPARPRGRGPGRLRRRHRRRPEKRRPPRRRRNAAVPRFAVVRRAPRRAPTVRWGSFLFSRHTPPPSDDRGSPVRWGSFLFSRHTPPPSNDGGSPYAWECSWCSRCISPPPDGGGSPIFHVPRETSTPPTRRFDHTPTVS